MPLAFQPSHCYNMGAVIPTEMPEFTRCTKFPHKKPNLCQAESEASVELLRRRVNTNRNNPLWPKIHPASCRGVLRKEKLQRGRNLLRKCMTIYPSRYTEGKYLHVRTFLTHVRIMRKNTKSTADEKKSYLKFRTPLRQAEDQVSGGNELRQTIKPQNKDSSHFV